jgi:Tfp pilus assembly protein FimT
MIKLSKNSNGFTVVEGLLIVIVVAVIGFGGYYVWHTQHKTSPAKTATTAAVKTTTPSKSTAPTSTSSSTNSVKYLTITQWGVKLALTSPIDNATYSLVTNNAYLPPSVFLSTSTLDASQDCVSYYQQGAPANDPTPTFQYISQYTLSQTTSLSEGGPTITAEQAAEQSPSTYIKVGNYVYTFGHGNGEPCSEQASNILPAFQTAFSTISAVN